MTASIVARRYAKALFAIGKDKGEAELEAYGKDLASLATVLEQTPELVKVFRNPIFSVEEKKAVVDKILSQLEPSRTIRNFFMLLADNDRLPYIPEINAYFGVLLDEEKGVVRGQLLTAIGLADAKQAEVKKQLESQLGKQLVLDFASDPAILGGVVLKVGDKILDASLRAQLSNMKEAMKRGD